MPSVIIKNGPMPKQDSTDMDDFKVYWSVEGDGWMTFPFATQFYENYPAGGLVMAEELAKVIGGKLQYVPLEKFETHTAPWQPGIFGAVDLRKHD